MHVHLDSKLAQDVGQGNATVCVDGLQNYADAARALAQCHEASGRCISWHHIPSHSDLLGHELADQAAAAGRLRIRCCEPTTVRRLVENPYLPWLWLGFAPCDMPSLSQLAKGYEHPDVLPAPCAQAVLDDVTSIATPKAKAATRVCFLSANLCTLGDKKPALLCQAEAQSIHVLAFQETRSRCAWQSHGRWFQFHSAAQAGQGGCSVLLDSQALRLKKEDCVTVEARADLLCVHVKSTAFHGTIISFHAPHSLKPEEEIRGWWQRFDAFVSSVQSKGPMVWLGDANARLGAGHSMCHGSYGAEASNLAGEQFASVAEKYSCVIANTHAEIMHGVDHRTWRDRRLDYIVLPPAWVAGAFAHPPSCFDLLNPHDDHRPVIISCCVPAASVSIRQNHRHCTALDSLMCTNTPNASFERPSKPRSVLDATRIESLFRPVDPETTPGRERRPSPQRGRTSLPLQPLCCSFARSFSEDTVRRNYAHSLTFCHSRSEPGRQCDQRRSHLMGK